MFYTGKIFAITNDYTLEKNNKSGGNKPSISAGSLGFKGEYKKHTQIP